MVKPGKLYVFVEGIADPLEVLVHRVEEASYKTDMYARVQEIFREGLAELIGENITCFPPHRIRKIEFDKNAPKGTVRGNRI
jgi:hypothetical protein